MLWLVLEEDRPPESSEERPRDDVTAHSPTNIQAVANHHPQIQPCLATDFEIARGPDVLTTQSERSVRHVSASTIAGGKRKLPFSAFTWRCQILERLKTRGKRLSTIIPPVIRAMNGQYLVLRQDEARAHNGVVTSAHHLQAQKTHRMVT
jgi:hypothetical protein